MIILTKACLSPTHPPGVHHPPTERRNPTRRRHNCDATPQCLPEHAGQLPRKHTPPGNRIATVGDRWQNTGENVSAREPRYRRASSLQTSSIRRPIHEPRRPTVTNVVQTADISAFCRNTRLRWTTFVTHKQKEPLQEHRTKRPDPHVLKRAPRPPARAPGLPRPPALPEAHCPAGEPTRWFSTTPGTLHPTINRQCLSSTSDRGRCAAFRGASPLPYASVG